MRSHVKASSAGSTQGQGSHRVSFACGADATRALADGADGSGALAYRGGLVAFSFAAALLALALFASSAFASKQVISYFGTTAGSGSFGGELNNPRDVAANGTGVGPANAGDTYVADEANNRIERFAANGTFVSAWGKDVIAASINERQRIVVKAATGTYTLSFNGSTTAPLQSNSGSGDVRGALAALPSVGGSANVAVSGEGTRGAPFIVTFQGARGGADQPTITADATQLNGGTISISTIANGAATVANDTGSAFQTCTVATECQAGTASGENGALDHPQSVAVDQDTGNVYVSDRGNRRIDEYDGVGVFIRSFGFDVAESGPGNTGTGYEVCNQAASDVCKAGVGGSGVGQYGSGSTQGFGIAASPADGNVSTGSVYLANSGNQRVETFNLDGTSPANFGSSANFGSEQPRSVAVDSRGIVYASDSNKGGDIQRYDSLNANGVGVGFLAPIVPPANEVQKVSFSGFEFGDSFRLTCPGGEQTGELTYSEEIGREIIQLGLEGACGAGTVSASGNPPNTTVTFQGALGGANQPQMTCIKLSGAGSCSVSTTSDGNGGPLPTGNAASATAGLAVDPDSDGAGPDVDVLYVLRDPSSGATVVQQFGSTTSPPGHAPGLTAAPTAVDDTHGATLGLTNVQGFGLDNASGRLFVSATNDPDGEGKFGGPIAAAHRVYVINDASSLANPTATMKPIAVKASRTATFEASVDPKGGLISCKFQYSTDGATWTDVTAPVPDCPYLDPNGGAQDVSQDVSGLIPGTEYSVRLQVTRPYFTTFTPVTTSPQSFSTDTAAPLVSGAVAKTIDDSSVRFTASVDPSNSPTTYVVQYGASEALGSSTAPVSIGAGTSPVGVSPVISGLAPATKYYFKLVATNLIGSTPSAVLTRTTFTTPPSFGETCPNNRFRVGPSAKLPDCRAYEQATPTNKFGSDVGGRTFSVEASRSGDGVTFHTIAGFPGGDAFQEIGVYLSRFAGGEWSTHGLTTPPNYGDNASVEAWTPDLELTFTRAYNSATEGNGVIMRDSSDGSHTVILPQTGFEFFEFELGGTFDDDSKVVFTVDGNPPVASGPAPVGSNNVYLYDRDTGALTLAGLLPDSACGSPPCVPSGGSQVPAAYGAYIEDGHAVSSDGDVYFTDRGTGQLYLRRDVAGPGASTVAVSASEATVPDPNGTFASTFQGATPDGSHAFFTSEQELTNGASTAAGTKDLYRFDAGAPAGSRLTDLVPGAKVVGLAGYSDDAEYVYFVANADLDAGGPATAGNCEGLGKQASGSCSLYLWRADGAGGCASAGGCVTFIAPQSIQNEASDGQNWGTFLDDEMKTSRVSADGHTLVFRSALKLTDYDNKGSREFYRYDAGSGQLSCLTCNPTGAPPTITSDQNTPALKDRDLEHSNTSHFSYDAQPFLSRNLSPDGKRFFFQTAEKLVPADVNGDQACPVGKATLGSGPACLDVYEWEAPGKGSCTLTSGAFSPANEGCIYLLSAGTGAYPSYLADVSESGDTAFIFSRDQLVPADQDLQEDLYAVKVDGGLASQHAVRPAACEGDACRGASSQAPDNTGAGSAVFEGPGNPTSNTNKTRCPKGKRQVRAKGKVRCIAKKHKKRGKGGHQKRHHNRANDNRRASR